MVPLHVQNRFWSKVEKQKDGCWLWKSAIVLSYGTFTFNYKSWKAHRFAWFITNGEIPAHKLICHKCDNKLCVNPNHLFIGSPKNNTQDAIAKGIFVPDRYLCAGRGLCGTRNGAAKLDEKQVKKILELYNSTKTSYVRLAKEFNVSRFAIYAIVKGITWTGHSKGLDFPERFWSKADQQIDGCWIWRTPSNGRGAFRHKGKNWIPSRLAWIITHGAIPSGLVVCHKCDNGLCVNPDHLFLGTRKENSQDAIRKGRFAPGKYPRELGFLTKLTESNVEEIINSNLSQRKLADKFGVSKRTIRNAINSKKKH